MVTLVTGGAGFVGRHVVQQLRAEGTPVRVLDLQPGASQPGVDYLQGSITAREDVAGAVTGADTVLHLAANAYLWARDARDFERINHQGTTLLLDEARKAGVRRMVHVSSLTVLIGATHGRGQSTVSEATRLSERDMLGPYPLSKLRAETAALDASTTDFAVTAVLPTQPLGPGDDGLTAPTRMILDLITGKIPAYLDCTHNIVHVGDVARGILRARTRGVPGARYVLGGENISMADLLNRLARMTGAPMPTARVPYPVALAAGHVAEWVSTHLTHRPPQAPLTGVRLAGRRVAFDSSRAQTELGFAPRPLEMALRDTIRWLIDAGHVARPLPAFQ